MRPVLVTSSGKLGDAIWSLALVREIKKRDPLRPLVFGVPAPFAQMLPIALQQSDYVNGVVACEDPGFVSPVDALGYGDLCKWEVPAPGGDDAWHEVWRVGFRSLPRWQLGEHNAYAMGKALGIQPNLASPWLASNPANMNNRRIAISLHDASLTYGQPWLSALVEALPSLLLRNGWREVFLVGGSKATPIHEPLAEMLRRRELYVMLQGCCFLCGAIAIETCEAMISIDSASHALAVGMGRSTLTLRRNHFLLRTPWSKEIQPTESTETALQKLSDFLEKGV